MQITRATDYAVRVTVHLACLPPDHNAPLGELAEAIETLKDFRKKVVSHIVRHGLVSSHRGTGGGFRLNVTPESLSLLQVVEAIEGKIALNICLSEWQSCPLQRQCAVHPVWQRAQAALSQELAAVTIAEFGGADKREIELSDGRSTVRRPRHAVNAVRLHLGIPVC